MVLISIFLMCVLILRECLQEHGFINRLQSSLNKTLSAFTCSQGNQIPLVVRLNKEHGDTVAQLEWTQSSMNGARIPPPDSSGPLIRASWTTCSAHYIFCLYSIDLVTVIVHLPLQCTFTMCSLNTVLTVALRCSRSTYENNNKHWRIYTPTVAVLSPTNFFRDHCGVA